MPATALCFVSVLSCFVAVWVEVDVDTMHYMTWHGMGLHIHPALASTAKNSIENKL